MPIRFFISYPKKSKDVAHQLTVIIEKLGHIAIRDELFLDLGDFWAEEIRVEINASDVVIVLVSDETPSSHWVKREASAAWGAEKLMFPVFTNFELLEDDSLKWLQAYMGCAVDDFEKQIARFINNNQNRITRDRDFIDHLNIAANGLSESIVDGESLNTKASIRDINPMIRIKNPEHKQGAMFCGPALDGHIMIDTIHAGDFVPREFTKNCQDNWRESQDYTDVDRLIKKGYSIYKDWGANYLAAGLTQVLNVEHHYRVNIAAVLLDFGGFADAGFYPSDRRVGNAIGYPFSSLLNHEQKRILLQRVYDAISAEMDTALSESKLRISIRTYEKHSRGNSDDLGSRPRPEMNLVFLEKRHLERRIGASHPFDPLFPSLLAESIKARKLADRLVRDLTADFSIDRNHFQIPVSVQEIRSRVWYFFLFLRDRFEDDHPDTKGQEEYSLAWDMLLDTNLRSADSDFLRSYIHRLRNLPARIFPEIIDDADLQETVKARLDRARDAYKAIGYYLRQNHGSLISKYSRSPLRSSSLAIEIRRDLLWNYDPNGRPLPPVNGLNIKMLRKITRSLGMSIYNYLHTDGAEDFA